MEEDDGWQPWTDWVPLRIVAGAPVSSEGDVVPAYVADWQR